MGNPVKMTPPARVRQAGWLRNSSGGSPNRGCVQGGLFKKTNVKQLEVPTNE